MKRVLLLVCILVLAGGLSAQALNLESFRYQATTSLYDDLDYAINGTDVYMVEGARIFTNLSNLSSGTENLMGYGSDNTLVVGYVTPEFWGLKSAFFWGTMKDLIPDYLGLDLDDDGFNDVWGYGFLTGEWTREWDANNDGSIDYIDYRYGQIAGEDIDHESDILVNIAKDMGPGTFLALTYRRTNDKFESIVSDSVYFQTEDYSNGDLQMFERAYDGTDDIYSVPSDIFSISYEMPFIGYFLRGDVTYGMSRNKYDYNYHGSFFYNYAPVDPLITDTELDTTYSVSLDEYSDNLVGLSLRLRNDDPDLMWWVGGHFGMDFGSGDYESSTSNYSRDRFMVSGNVASDTYEYLNEIVAPVDVSGMNFGGFGRMEWQISPNVRFGIGARFSSMKTKREYDRDFTYNVTSVYDDGDAEANDPDDYTETTQSGRTEVLSYETVTDRIEVPCGFEVTIGKNKDWFIRLGAIGIKENSNFEEILEVGEVEREVYTIVYGDGTSSTTYEDVDYQSYKENSYDESQYVNFAYGLGWKPSENVSFDLLGMFDLSGTELISTDWFRSLKISATVAY